jgi:hypothetical protein
MPHRVLVIRYVAWNQSRSEVRGAVEDRPGRGMDVKAAGRASPGLTLLLGLVALKDAAALAARAMGMFAVSGVAGPPQML